VKTYIDPKTKTASQLTASLESTVRSGRRILFSLRMKVSSKRLVRWQLPPYLLATVSLSAR
jgi:hypothetical protein